MGTHQEKPLLSRCRVNAYMRAPSGHCSSAGLFASFSLQAQPSTSAGEWTVATHMGVLDPMWGEWLVAGEEQRRHPWQAFTTG